MAHVSFNNKKTNPLLIILPLLLLFGLGIYLFLNSEKKEDKKVSTVSSVSLSSESQPTTCPPGTHAMGNMGCMSNDTGIMVHDMAGLTVDEKSFVTGMIPHHQEAVDSANELLTVTRNEDLKKFLNSIINAQEKEIKDMKQWHKEWYGEDWKSDGVYVPMMRPISMRNTEEVTTKNWLQDMIHHHQGAVDMANKVLTFPGIHEQTETLAKNILEAQNAEIEQMNAWLNEMK